MPIDNRPKIACLTKVVGPRHWEFTDAIIERLTVVAVAFGSPAFVTAELLRLYAEALVAELTIEQIDTAVNRAIRELDRFPSLAKLRALAGAAAAPDRAKVEAEGAWQWAQDYLRQWGADRLPIRSRGVWVEAPAIPPRIDYALRRVGGLRGLNQIDEKARPFMFRDFCEAYALAPIATSLDPHVFGLLEGKVRQLAQALPSEPDHDVQKPQASAAERKPGPLTVEQVRERRAALARQAEMLAAQRRPAAEMKGGAENRP